MEMLISGAPARRRSHGADRQVTASRKNSDGDILALCHPGAYWSPRSKADAINDIRNRVHSYFVKVGTRRVEIRVVSGPTGPYPEPIPTRRPTTTLDDLPGC